MEIPFAARNRTAVRTLFGEAQKRVDFLLELFLTEFLRYDSHFAHREAARLENHISNEFEEKIDALLGFPEKCPHGSPIPSREGNFQVFK